MLHRAKSGESGPWYRFSAGSETQSLSLTCVSLRALSSILLFFELASCAHETGYEEIAWASLAYFHRVHVEQA